MTVVAPYRLQKGSRLTQKVNYPSFGAVGMPAAAGGTSVRPRPLRTHLLQFWAHDFNIYHNFT